MYFHLSRLVAFLASLQLALSAAVDFVPLTTCQVGASGDPSIDDAPTILEAFERCRKSSRIVFAADTTYHINSVMEVRDLQDVEIDFRGTLLVSSSLDFIISFPFAALPRQTLLIIFHSSPS